MSDSTDELIAEATTQLKHSRVLSGNGYNEQLIQRLIDQLQREKAARLAVLAAAQAEPRVLAEMRIREITKATIERRPYDDHTRREIRGLENAIAREVASELTKEN